MGGATMGRKDMSIKDDNCFTFTFIVEGWMVNKLGLSGNALIAYAVIYRFSQDGKSSFQASVSYLASCVGVSRGGMTKILNGLLEKGYITKREVKDKDGGQSCNIYKAVNIQP
jgi:DNA-binding MarR family transcriptional regulator